MHTTAIQTNAEKELFKALLKNIKKHWPSFILYWKWSKTPPKNPKNPLLCNFILESSLIVENAEEEEDFFFDF